MFVDYVLNGAGFGEVHDRLMGCRYEPNLLRPFIGADGRRYVTMNVGKDKEGKPIFKNRLVRDMVDLGLPIPTTNAATSLRKDEWLQLDRQVLQAARQRLRAWSDLESASTFGGFDAMSKMVLEHETMSDPGEAVVDMDGRTPGRVDTPLFQLEGLPLPITHMDFGFSSRRLAVSRNSGTPLDSTMAEVAGRRVAEKIEKTLIGVDTGVTYGDKTGRGYSNNSTVYGYMNHPDILTKTTVTTPDGTNGATTVDDVLAMIEQLNNANFYGPFMLYHSTDWDKYMDDDYRAHDSRTLRQRLRQIEAISDVRRLDFLDSTTYPFRFIMVQMTSEVARAINGMDIMTVQWETKGGLELNFKVMAIKVPQLRSDYNGNTGILLGTTS